MNDNENKNNKTYILDTDVVEDSENDTDNEELFEETKIEMKEGKIMDMYMDIKEYTKNNSINIFDNITYELLLEYIEFISDQL